MCFKQDLWVYSLNDLGIRILLEKLVNYILSKAKELFFWTGCPTVLTEATIGSLQFGRATNFLKMGSCFFVYKEMKFPLCCSFVNADGFAR